MNSVIRNTVEQEKKKDSEMKEKFYFQKCQGLSFEQLFY